MSRRRERHPPPADEPILIVTSPGGEGHEDFNWMNLREPIEAAFRAGLHTSAQHVRLFEALMRAAAFPALAADRQRLQAACRLWDEGEREAAKRVVGFTRRGDGRRSGPGHREVLAVYVWLTTGYTSRTVPGPVYAFGWSEDEANRIGRGCPSVRLDPGQTMTPAQAREAMRAGWKRPSARRVQKLIEDARAALKDSTDREDRELVARSYQRPRR